MKETALRAGGRADGREAGWTRHVRCHVPCGHGSVLPIVPPPEPVRPSDSGAFQGGSVGP